MKYETVKTKNLTISCFSDDKFKFNSRFYEVRGKNSRSDIVLSGWNLVGCGNKISDFYQIAFVFILNKCLR